MSFVMTDEFSVMMTKMSSKIGVPWTHNLSIFNQFKLNELWPFYRKHVTDNFE